MTTKNTQNSAKRFMAALALGLLAVAAGAQTWTFDSGAEGWQVNDFGADWVTSFGVTQPTWSPSGGAPGGFVSAQDPSSATFVFEKLALGDYSTFVGGKLGFALQCTANSWDGDNVVVFRGGAADQILVTQIGALPATTWTDYSLDLTADKFRYGSKSGGVVNGADFASVMGNLTAVRISAEYGASTPGIPDTFETTGLDRVSFTAIPEPATSAAMLGLVALGGTAWVRRRRG